MSSKLREALEEILNNAKDIYRYPYSFNIVLRRSWDIMVMITKIKSEPLRNCDVGTPREQAERFNDFCNSHYNLNNPKGVCSKCPLTRDGSTCEFEWSQMPYESEVK